MKALTAWQEKFAEGLREGRDAKELLQELNISPSMYQHSLRDNPSFKNLVDISESGVGSGVLCPAELEHLMVAQVSEENAAGYFGMTLPDFRKAVDEDPELKRVFETGPLKGKAILQVRQWEYSEKDGDMLKWLGKNHAGQADKIETKTTVETTSDPDEIIKLMEFLEADLANRLGKTIDGEVIDITPQEEPLAIEAEKSDT